MSYFEKGCLTFGNIKWGHSSKLPYGFFFSRKCGFSLATRINTVTRTFMQEKSNPGSQHLFPFMCICGSLIWTFL